MKHKCPFSTDRS